MQKVAEPATRKDKAVAEDLLDTLKANKAICVGLAANMIGVAKSIIAVQVGKQNVAMLNPQIVKHADECSEVMEGCLSLLGNDLPSATPGLKWNIGILNSNRRSSVSPVLRQRLSSMKSTTVRVF